MKSLLFRMMHPRKTQIFCVGTGKSGTHTLAEIWGKQLRTAHEPETEIMLGLYLKWKSGNLNDKAIIDFIIRQDKRLWLEVNSSAVNFLFLELLATIFPKSKYILTIRNPYTSLDSFFNHQLTRNCSPNWHKLRELRFRPDFYTHPEEEQSLKEHSLYTLDGYLSNWNEHNKKVLDTIPKERLLIVRTDQIAQNLDNLARFAGLKNGSKIIANCHVFPSEKKFNILDQLNADYLEYKIQQHCGELMTIFFPEIKSYPDAFKQSS